MRAKKHLYLFVLVLLPGITACNLPGVGVTNEPASTLEATSQPVAQERLELPATPQDSQPLEEEPGLQAHAPILDPQSRLQPSDLVYLGAFRLPGGSGGSNWEYSGQGLTYYPEGDPGGGADGFPGSLYGIGHDQQLYISEISIPSPVNSPDLESLPTATTLQPFADLTKGIFVAEEMDIPTAGIEYLSPQGDQTSSKLHFVWGQHFQEFEPSHGWAELDLSNPQPAGPWIFNGYTNYVTSDYLFEIPAEWADTYAPGMRLATGRAREGLWSGRGPGLFAYAPWLEGNPPSPETTLTHILPLLLYGVQEPGGPDIVGDETMAVNGYTDADHWMGGAWLTAAGKSAVILVGTKAIGEAWYGFANGVVWPHDCAENNSCPEVPEWPYDNRGYWAEGYEAEMIFYDPIELGAVAAGQMATWEPQPYAVMSLQALLYNPDLDYAAYRRDLLGAAAYDRGNGILYVIERLADESKSVIHVWRLQTDGG